MIARQEPEHLFEKRTLPRPKFGIGHRHEDAELARPRVLRRLHAIDPRVGGMHHRREDESVDADFAWIDPEPSEAPDDAAHPVSQSPIAAQEIDAELSLPATCEIRRLVGWSHVTDQSVRRHHAISS